MIKIVNNSPKLLGEYINGNYKVSIYSDGTKIRETLDENSNEFIADFPESMDVKITNNCDMNCLWCHENSTKNGEHGEILTEPFWTTLNPYTEIAIGGGNPLKHPDLMAFLLKLQKLNLIPSMTVNQKHFMENISFLEFLCKEKLIYGLGISLVEVTDEFITKVQKFPNAVLHIINGIVKIEQLKQLENKDLKVLILGYKEFRRGKEFYSSDVEENKSKLQNYLPSMFKTFKVVSFDNLAIKQLKIKEIVSKEEWEEFYMGNDGQYTMYIDLVNKKYAISSISEILFDLERDIKSMFKRIKD